MLRRSSDYGQCQSVLTGDDVAVLQLAPYYRRSSACMSDRVEGFDGETVYK